MENQEVTNTGETIVKTGSSSDAVSFEELEALDSTPSPKKEKAPAKEEPEGDEYDPGTKEKSRKQDEKPAKEKVAEKLAKEKAPEKTEAGEKVKVLKMKSGDAELDVPADAKVMVPVNGKMEEFTVQEIVNEFSGKTHWNKKFQELDVEKKTFQSEVQALQSSIDDMYDLAVTQKKPMEAVAMLADLLGGNGAEVVKTMMQGFEEQFNKYSGMSDAERESVRLQEENQLLNARINRQKISEARSAESAKLAKRVEEAKSKYNITDDEFKEVYNTLKSKVKPEELTPEFVADVHQRWKRMDQVAEVVTGLGIDAAAMENAEKALNTEWRNNPDLTVEDIKSIAEQVYGKKAASKLTTKIKKSGGDSGSTEAQKKKSEPLFFDDL